MGVLLLNSDLKKSFEEGALTYFCPTLDPPLGESDRKALTRAQGHPTKSRKYASVGSVEKADYLLSYIYMHKCTPFPPSFTRISYML